MKEETKTDKLQCTLSSEQVQNPWRQWTGAAGVVFRDTIAWRPW